MRFAIAMNLICWNPQSNCRIGKKLKKKTAAAALRYTETQARTSQKLEIGTLGKCTLTHTHADDGNKATELHFAHLKSTRACILMHKHAVKEHESYTQTLVRSRNTHIHTRSRKEYE